MDDRLLRKLLEELCMEGRRIVEEQLGNVNYTHRTHNLQDSYGWCVYYGGKKWREGYYTPNAVARRGKKWYGRVLEGREEIKKLFRRYKPVSGIELAIGVAMPYGMVLEEQRKFRVFALSHHEIEKLARKYKGGASYHRM